MEPLRTPKILLVEDDPEQRAHATEILSAVWPHVRSASSAAEAIRLHAAEAFDVVICDLGLPDRDGFAVARSLHEDSPNPPILIMLTGRNAPEDVVRGLEAGASDYLIKPVNPEELIARTRAMIRLRGRLTQFARAASTDSLTGLWNRHHLHARRAELTSLADRSAQAFSCLVLDLDRFKNINDTFGHAAGDEVLRCVAQRIVDTQRSSDIPFRIGGEEFAVIAMNTSLEAATKLARRITSAIRSEPVDVVTLDDRETRITVTTSVGVAERLPREPLDAVLRRADAAVIRAKRLGRNRIEVDRADYGQRVEETG